MHRRVCIPPAPPVVKTECFVCHEETYHQVMSKTGPLREGMAIYEFRLRCANWRRKGEFRSWERCHAEKTEQYSDIVPVPGYIYLHKFI